MARYGQKLESSFFKGEIPTLNLSDEEWRHLLSIIQKLGKSGGDKQAENSSRAELKSICDKYLEHRTRELKATKVSECQKLIDDKKKIVKAVGELARLCSLPGKTDSDKVISTKFETSLLEYFDSHPIHLDVDSVVERDKDGGDWKLSHEENSRKRFGVKLSYEHLYGVAIQVSSALKEIEQGLSQYKESGSNPFQPGLAFQEWIYDVKQWAKANGYYHGYSLINGEPPPFAIFAFRLHNLFPHNCRENQLSSTVAMGKRIGRSTLSRIDPNRKN